MNFKMTKIAAGVAMVVAASSAHAVLTSSNTLSIQNDAVTSYGSVGVTTSGSPNPPGWYVSSNGALLDSFFTMGGSTAKQALNTQYAYLYNGANLTLNGATQSGVATWTYYGAAGDNKTVTPGISVLTASGDTATVDMSGWMVDWNGINNIPMTTGAWGNYNATTPYANGVGYVKCTTGSGCAAGSNYTLKYTSTVPAGDPSGFGTVQYYLELHGTVAAVPEASTYGMMLAGLGLVGFAVRRRKQVI